MKATVRDNSGSYPDLYPPFVWWSFILALGGGFGLAAHLSVVLSYGFQTGPSFLALIQAHAHLQLFGWIGFLLMGISLYVLPRLTSSPAGSGPQARTVFLWAHAGVLLRALSPVFIGYLSPSGRWLCAVSTLIGACAEGVAIALYLAVVTRGVRLRTADRHELTRLLPYFAPMLVGWVLWGIGQILLASRMLVDGSAVPSPVWNTFLNELFTRGVLVSAILGFGVKMLPIFLGLRPPLWPVRRVGTWFAAGTTGLLVAEWGMAFGGSAPTLRGVGAIALLLVSAAQLWYVWELDALLFRITPERISLKQFRSDAQQQRGRFGDRGEFGRFELFIVAGFAWLALVSLLEGANSLLGLCGHPALVSSTVLRHMLLLGCVAHIVCGIGHRLLPNLLHVCLRWPALTGVSFCCLTLAALLRTVPLALAEHGVAVSPHLFALSGPLGLLSVVLFGLNLWRARER